MSASALAPVLLVLAGPAGSGKTTLCDRMVTTHPEFSRVITTTTRPPRPGEVDGVHYHFFDDATFDARIAAGAFLEWARVHGAHRRYGTLKAAVLEPLAAGRSLIINVDVQGVRAFRQAAAADALLARHLATVFIDVPIPVLRARLVGRESDSAEEIERRMQTAERELLEKPHFDFVIPSHDRDTDFAALEVIWRDVAARVARATGRA